jgi:hypothetical protein
MAGLAGSAAREAFRECRTVALGGSSISAAVRDTWPAPRRRALRWWPDLDGFAHQSWPLAERIDVQVDLVLRDGFTVGWDIGTG